MWVKALYVVASSAFYGTFFFYGTFCGASLPSIEVFLMPLSEPMATEHPAKWTLCVCDSVQKAAVEGSIGTETNLAATSSPPSLGGNSSVDARPLEHRDWYSESENIRFQAVLDANGDQALADEFIRRELGDIVKSRSVNAVRQKLARMYYKRRTTSALRYTKVEEELMRAQTLIYRQTDPKKEWTRVAIEENFPELVSKHGIAPLRTKLSRLGRTLNYARGQTHDLYEKTKSIHDTRHRVYKYYSPAETVVLIRAALENRPPSDGDKRALSERDPDAIRHKIASIRKKLLRAQPERMLPCPFNPTGDS